jgi:hypothetical protein
MDIFQLHNIFIILHAASGTISFFAGAVLLFWSKYIFNRRVFALYLWSLVGLVVFLALAMLTFWTQYSNSERIIFTGLLGLSLYMLYRARSASRLLKAQKNDWKHDYVDHIGFTLISLFEGFIIVTIINLGGSVWLVALFAIVGVFVGRWAIGLAQKRISRS